VRATWTIAGILAALALLSPLAGPAGAAGSEEQRAASVTVAILPSSTTIADLAEIEGIVPGLASAGIGGPGPAAQTYLDISQGARVFRHFYDEPLRFVELDRHGVERSIWRQVTERADSAPARVVPGLLASTLRQHDLLSRAEERIGEAALIAVDRDGRVERLDRSRCGQRGCGPGLSVIEAPASELPLLVSGLRGSDLLIAIRDAPPAEGRQLPIGIAGRGFEDGALTSDSTRTDGFVLSVDIAPSILGRLGIETPGEMSGQPIRAEGKGELAALEALDLRLGSRPAREPVVGTPLLAWVLATALAALAFGARGGRLACALLALSGAYLPLLLLVGAALKPSETVEALLVGFGSPLAAALTLAAFGGFLALAVACAITVAAHAVDVIVGSPLTSLSVLGPNPAGGVRFFGIGNELEATVGVLVPLGVGAWLGARPDRSPVFAAAAFVLFAALGAAIFAPGRFGADVGAAIVLPAGAAVAATLVLGLSRRVTLIALAAMSVAGVGAVIAVDLVLGGDAHLSRSVLGAEDLGELGDVVVRRLRLTVRSFLDPSYPLLLVLTLVLLALGFRNRHRISRWFGDRQPARAGFVGALAATLVGTAANDSGAILLIFGTIYLAIAAGFFWARSPAPGESALGVGGK
jgi:hypothetical protein